MIARTLLAALFSVGLTALGIGHCAAQGNVADDPRNNIVPSQLLARIDYLTKQNNQKLGSNDTLLLKELDKNDLEIEKSNKLISIIDEYNVVDVEIINQNVATI